MNKLHLNNIKGKINKLVTLNSKLRKHHIIVILLFLTACASYYVVNREKPLDPQIPEAGIEKVLKL